MRVGRIPRRFAEARLDGVDYHPFEMVKYYAENMDRCIMAGNGLLLSGPPGVGKTWALAALTYRYHTTHARGDYLFLTAPALFDLYGRLRDEWDDHRGQWWGVVMETVPWLVINDLGKENRQGGNRELVAYKLGRLLRARSERKRVTHITTNFRLTMETPDTPTVGTEYGESIASLLREMVVGYEVTGPDRRSNS